MNGKVKGLDTNFVISVFDSDSLLCSVNSYSNLVAPERIDEKPYSISSLIKLPVIKLDSSVNLVGQIEFNNKTLRWDAQLWKYQDSLKFYDSFGLYIFEYTKPRKIPKNVHRDWPLGKFRKAILIPDDDDFPFIMIGWNLEEIMIEMEQIENP